MSGLASLPRLSPSYAIAIRGTPYSKEELQPAWPPDFSGERLGDVGPMLRGQSRVNGIRKIKSILKCILRLAVPHSSNGVTLASYFHCNGGPVGRYVISLPCERKGQANETTSSARLAPKRDRCLGTLAALGPGLSSFVQASPCLFLPRPYSDPIVTTNSFSSFLRVRVFPSHPIAPSLFPPLNLSQRAGLPPLSPQANLSGPVPLAPMAQPRLL